MGMRSLAALPANTLDRDFQAPGPNAKWVADFTFVWVLEGWLHVAVVLGRLSRRGRPKAVLHRSDRGRANTAVRRFNARLPPRASSAR